ncbi:MAG: ABC transporter ATP-binding protein [Marinifilaceae bacterium]
MIVELDRISKYYENPETVIKREILKEISLEITSGDSLAIVGPSGSGKSTLLNIIGSLDRCSSGSILYDGKDISSLGEMELAQVRNKNIGFVFQAHHLLPQLNLIENVLLPVLPEKDKKQRKAAQERAMELLTSVGLADRIHQRPGQLSGGECQRAAVVRALINEPGLILADEPTGSLDQDSAEQLGELLAEINRKHQVAMVVVTHALQLAHKMKSIYKLSNGLLIPATKGIETI